MHSTPYDLRFTLFGFQTSIQPFFWVVAALITAINIGPIENMPVWFSMLFIGMAGVALSVLVHELGHAFSFRHLFNVPCVIVLHGLGGMAAPLIPYRYSYSLQGVMARCFLSFSGPLAGFILAAVMITLAVALPLERDSLLWFFLNWTAIISIIWGIFNLLPIYPMDGGHIAREVFAYIFPRRGVEYSLIFSIMLAIALGLAALMFGYIIITVLFGYFAYVNYQELTGGR